MIPVRGGQDCYARIALVKAPGPSLIKEPEAPAQATLISTVHLTDVALNGVVRVGIRARLSVLRPATISH